LPHKAQAALIVAARAIVFATEPTFVVATVGIHNMNGICSGLTALRFVADATSRTALECADDQLKCQVRGMLAGSLAVPLARNTPDDRLPAAIPNDVVRLAMGRCDLLPWTSASCEYDQLLRETVTFLREVEVWDQVCALAASLERFGTVAGDALQKHVTTARAGGMGFKPSARSLAGPQA
jgi:hypothetical protein